MSTLRVGIIGFGRIGAEHASWISQAGATVAAVFDPTPERAELARSHGLKTTGSMEELLSLSTIDAVLVATPTSFHFDHASAALRAGKHVMIEKPMALDLAQSSELVELSEACSRTLSVFHNRRWDADFLTVKRLINSGDFGRVFNIESRIGQFASCVGPAAREWNPNWRNQSAFGGGGLYDWGSHLVDQMLQLMLPARPVRVFAQLRGNVWTKDCDDFARVCIDFESVRGVPGAVGLIEINTTTTTPLPRWHIDGERGSADSPYSLTFDTNDWRKLSFVSTRGDSSIAIAGEPMRSDVEPMIWQSFSNACLGIGEPAVAVESVLSTMSVLDAARRSSVEGRVVVPE